jgi:hypothetical protein
MKFEFNDCLVLNDFLFGAVLQVFHWTSVLLVGIPMF